MLEQLNPRHHVMLVPNGDGTFRLETYSRKLQGTGSGQSANDYYNQHAFESKITRATYRTIRRV